MAIQGPQDLFLYNLCAMYDIEQKLVQMLPQLAQECPYAQAREAFMLHEQETRQHIRNLEQCFQILGSQPMVLENHTVAGLKGDHDTFLQQQPPQPALILFDLNAGYQSECIEIAAYHNLIDTANNLGLQSCTQLLQQNLLQEVEASKKLSMLAHQFGEQQIQATRAPVSSQPMPSQPYTAGSQMPNQPSGTASPSMPGTSRVQEGMQVVGSDMDSVGRVRDVRENDFLVDISMQRDVYVPFTAVQNVDADRVVLNIPAGQVNNMNWPKPSIT